MDSKELLIQKLTERIAVLEQLVEYQASKITELEKRLNKNSSNSSKPPSSDGLAKPPKSNSTSLRQNGKNKSGGQPGHKGETLKQTDSPDKVERHFLDHCPKCSSSLTLVKSLGVIKRQVFDIPLPTIQITEHQAETKMCPCCNRRVLAAFPYGVNAPVQYGEGVKSYAIYLSQQLIPEDRLQETLKELFNINLATATFTHFSESAYEELAVFDADVLSKVKESPVKHLDETGFRVSGKTQWLHVASTERMTHYHISPKRKSLLEDLTGIVVHDHWKSYYQLNNVFHALCNQHHLRELKSVIEYNKEKWAHEMQRFLRVGLRYRHHYADKPIPDNLLNRLMDLYEKIIQKGIRYHEDLPEYSKKGRRGRQKKRTGHNLVLRLKNYRDDVLRFLINPIAPFTNNQAERDLRMMKCKQKISGGFRSEKGAQIFVRIRGFISTARKQGWNIFESIRQLVQAQTPKCA